jgi:hypothetical protein
LKEFEALAREALGSDEGVAPSETSDESVLDAPREVAVSSNGDDGEQVVASAPGQSASESQSSAEVGAVEGDEQAHKTAAAGE